MSRRSRRQKRNQQPSLTQHPLFIPGLILAAGVLFFVIGGIINNQPKGSSGGSANADCANGPASKQYSAPPGMQIDPAKSYTATIAMAKGGDIVIQLFPDKAPITVNSFVFLARDGYFNCVIFHRVLPDFMAQGGDPTGTGGGGPGYEFQNEDSDLKFDSEGVVAMANAGRDTNGSQFFITFGPQPSLDGGYTIFGKVIAGMDVVHSLTLRDPQDPSAPPGDVISTIVVEEK